MKSYVFPGQGSQFPGMGKQLYNDCNEAKEMMEKANEVLGFRLTDIMFEGSAEDLRKTEVTQPAVFVHSTVLALCSGLPQADMAAGHSLGEFSALAYAGALAFEDALALVAIRAKAMQKCCEAHPGSMAAIIGLGADEVEKLCAAEAAASGMTVKAANYNSPIQTVISGESAAVEAVCAAAKEAGAKRALVLPVGGAFHSPLMEDAREQLAAAIAATEFRTPRCPVYQNVSAKAETDPAAIKANLLAQLTAPVLWTRSVEQMLADGADSFTEIGPGTALAGLIRKIAPAETEIIGIQ